jgi:hypothetical protein
MANRPSLPRAISTMTSPIAITREFCSAIFSFRPIPPAVRLDFADSHNGRAGGLWQCDGAVGRTNFPVK